MQVSQVRVLLVDLPGLYGVELKTQLLSLGVDVVTVKSDCVLSECASGKSVVLVAPANAGDWLESAAAFETPIFLLGDSCEQARRWANVESLAADFPCSVLLQKILNKACAQPRLADSAWQAKLASLQQELERTISVRDNFLSMASHELRTPLNGLVLDTQLRKLQIHKGNLAAFSEERIRLMIERDERQLLAMVRIVDDMVDSSRIRTGQFGINAQPMNLVELVEQIVERFRMRFEMAECPLVARYEGILEGCWDSFRIEQVVSNLLTNALRYGMGKPVEVRVWREADQARVSVADHGIGISSHDQSRIFCEFERAVAHHFSPGLGLGLFISEQIANAHGGSIELESELGQGSVFTLCLPLTA